MEDQRVAGWLTFLPLELSWGAGGGSCRAGMDMHGTGKQRVGSRWLQQGDRRGQGASLWCPVSMFRWKPVEPAGWEEGTGAWPAEAHTLLQAKCRGRAARGGHSVYQARRKPHSLEGTLRGEALAKANRNVPPGTPRPQLEEQTVSAHGGTCSGRGRGCVPAALRRPGAWGKPLPLASLLSSPATAVRSP